MSTSISPSTATVADITTAISVDASFSSKRSATLSVQSSISKAMASSVRTGGTSRGTITTASVLSSGTGHVSNTRASIPSQTSTSSSDMTSVKQAFTGTSESSDFTTGIQGASETLNTTDVSTIASTTPLIVKQCAEPLAITGGRILSTGPYLANVSSAVYSCFAGYMLTGQAKIGCNESGFWNGRPPKCVQVDNRPDVHNHISLDDSTKVPIWLMVILCVAFGLLCLLLLACLITYCLKILGCWKNSAVGAKLVVQGRDVESGARNGVYRGSSLALVDDFGSNDKYYRSKRISYADMDDGFTTSRNYLTNTTPRISDVSNGRMYRREAKMPANKTWMPHSRNLRNINTSTK